MGPLDCPLFINQHDKQRKAADPRYPCTYAADYVRFLVGFSKGNAKLSRSDASRISEGIAAAIGMDKEDLKRRLADYFKANEDEITAKHLMAFMRETIPFNQSYKLSSLEE